MSQTEINRIINLLNEAYYGPAWPGPAVLETLKQLAPIDALKKISKSNNIAELVHHMTAWRNFTSKRLQGEETFEVDDDLNFVSYPTIDQKIWDELLERLEASQVLLLQLLSNIDDDKLKEQVKGRSYDFYILLQGIIQHDYYHLGQIVIMNKFSK